MASKKPTQRDVIQFYYKDKIRTAVILRIDDEGRVATVSYGTRTERVKVGLQLHEGRPSTNMIGLHSTTHFYTDHMLHIDYAVFRLTGKRCPPDVFTELELLLELRLLERKQAIHHYTQAEHAEALSAEPVTGDLA
jgi:hypothetical protein